MPRAPMPLPKPNAETPQSSRNLVKLARNKKLLHEYTESDINRLFKDIRIYDVVKQDIEGKIRMLPSTFYFSFQTSKYSILLGS